MLSKMAIFGAIRHKLIDRLAGDTYLIPERLPLYRLLCRLAARRGKPTAELGLILRTLSALDAQIEIPSPGGSPPLRNSQSEAFDYPDIDAIADGRAPRTPR